MFSVTPPEAKIWAHPSQWYVHKSAKSILRELFLKEVGHTILWRNVCSSSETDTSLNNLQRVLALPQGLCLLCNSIWVLFCRRYVECKRAGFWWLSWFRISISQHVSIIFTTTANRLIDFLVQELLNRHPMERWHTRAHLVNTYGCMTQRGQRGDISANLILYCESLELVEVT